MNEYMRIGMLIAEAMGLDIQEGLKRDMRLAAAIRKKAGGNVVQEPSGPLDPSRPSHPETNPVVSRDIVTQYGYDANPERFRPETRERLKHQDAATLAKIANRAERRAGRIAARGETRQGLQAVERGIAAGNKGAKQRGNRGARHNIIQTNPVIRTHAELSDDARLSADKMAQAAANARRSAREERLRNLQARGEKLGPNDPRKERIGTAISRFTRFDPSLDV